MLPLAESITTPMASCLIRRVELAFGGCRWILAITYRVLFDSEDMTGLHIISGVVPADVSAGMTRALLWSALRGAGAAYTLIQVGEMITARNLPAVRRTLWDAFAASMPDPRPKPGDKADDPGPMTRMEIWARARLQYRLSDQEWLDMTPRQMAALGAVDRARMRREELIAGQIATQIINWSTHAPAKPVSPEQFTWHKSEAAAEGPEPITGEHISRVLAMCRNQN